MFSFIIKVVLFALAVLPIGAAELSSLASRVQEFKLANGMRFLVVERRDAPVVSFHLQVSVGATDEPEGQGGLARLFEFLVRKGTPTIGSRNPGLEAQALAAVEKAYDDLDEARRKTPTADRETIIKLESRAKVLRETAARFANSNIFLLLLDNAGLTSYDVQITPDSSGFAYSLPVNRAEAWFVVISEWLQRHMFRDFYADRDMFREQAGRRMQGTPFVGMMSKVIAAAFAGHPYGRLEKWTTDMENLRTAHAEAFFKKHYVPGNMTVAVVGDMSAAEVRKLAEKFFAKIPAAPAPKPESKPEWKPPVEEKRIPVELAGPMMLMVAWHRSERAHPDAPVFDLLHELLAGNSGMLNQELVEAAAVSLRAGAMTTLPGGRYPNLFAITSMPAVGSTQEENEKAIYRILDKLQQGNIDARLFERAKGRLRSQAIRQLETNPGLAARLAYFESHHGSWKAMASGLEAAIRVTPADVQRVARQYFQPGSRIVAHTVLPPEPPKESKEAKPAADPKQASGSKQPPDTKQSPAPKQVADPKPPQQEKQ